MNVLLNHEIGTHAGLVFQALYEEESMTQSALKKSTGLTARQVDLALGWLARESKLVAELQGRTTRYSLA